MEFTVQNLCGFLIRSRLLSAEEVRVMYQRWLEDSREGSGDVARFARWLVEKEYVTEYQASLLGRGLPDNFFLNEYKILDRIGQGAMAGVYKGVHPRLGQVVAIKVLPPSRARNPRTLARFEREAELALRLKHPNVVRAFQIGEAAGLHYLVMEYLEGETLDEVLRRRGKLPPEEAVRLVYQALMGLQHIHEQGLVHRDLKPANLMLAPGRVPGQPDNTVHATVKILDIGLARPLFEEGNSGNSSKRNLTGMGVLLGTPDYLAPEQARNPSETDIRADIYSLGCVLYHALAGGPPFPDTNVITQMVRHQTETPRRLKEFNPAVPDGLQQIIDWMMAKAPGQRYATPARAAEALQVYLAAGTGPLRTPEGDPKTRMFLSWIEESKKGPKDGRKPAPEVKAGEKPAAPGSSRKLAKPPTMRKKSVPAPEGAREPRPQKTPVGEPPPSPPGPTQEPAEEFDVELVAEAPPPAAPPVLSLGQRVQFTARDLTILGIGLGVGVAVGAVLFLALRFGLLLWLGLACSLAFPVGVGFCLYWFRAVLWPAPRSISGEEVVTTQRKARGKGSGSAG